MRSILLISWKEIRQRVFNRSFVLSLILGPVFILTCVYILVKAADEGKKNVHVLIADPGDILQGVISSKEDPNVQYSFVSDYLEIVCGDHKSIKIKEIQRQGKKPQNIGEFMLGSQIKKGTVI